MEPEHLIAQVLNDLGMPTIRLHYKECTKGPGRSVPAQIRKGEITGICVMYQRRSNKEVPGDKINKFNREINIWVTHAIELGIDVYILGIIGTHWNNTVWEKLVNQGTLYESKHRFCALGIKPGSQEEPSNVCIKILSTRKRQPTPCKCRIPFDQHYSDWNHRNKDPDQNSHRNVMMEFCTRIAKQGMFEFGKSPGAEHLFPTEERVEWKRKRKENKEKGMKLRKR